jgi:hypothetical protein
MSKSLPNVSVSFVPLKYDEIIKRLELGEIQMIDVLLSGTREWNYGVSRFFEFSELNHIPQHKSTSASGVLTPLLERLLRFFYLPNETLNQSLQSLKMAPWQPCIGQKDIPCEPRSFSWYSWMRNPVGKSISKVIGDALPENFRKIKIRIDAINNL